MIFLSEAYSGPIFDCPCGTVLHSYGAVKEGTLLTSLVGLYRQINQSSLQAGSEIGAMEARTLNILTTVTPFQPAFPWLLCSLSSPYPSEAVFHDAFGSVSSAPV